MAKIVKSVGERIEVNLMRWLAFFDFDWLVLQVIHKWANKAHGWMAMEGAT